MSVHFSFLCPPAEDRKVSDSGHLAGRTFVRKLRPPKCAESLFIFGLPIEVPKKTDRLDSLLSVSSIKTITWVMRILFPTTMATPVPKKNQMGVGSESVVISVCWWWCFSDGPEVGPSKV